jgi:hypothetical protein
MEAQKSLALKMDDLLLMISGTISFESSPREVGNSLGFKGSGIQGFELTAEEL